MWVKSTGCYDLKLAAAKTFTRLPDDVPFDELTAWVWSHRERLQWVDDVRGFECISCGQLLVWHYAGSDRRKFCPICQKTIGTKQQQVGRRMTKCLASFCKKVFKNVEFEKREDWKLKPKLYDMRARCFNRMYGCTFTGRLEDIREHVKSCNLKARIVNKKERIAILESLNIDTEYIRDVPEEDREEMIEDVEQWIIDNNLADFHLPIGGWAKKMQFTTIVQHDATYWNAERWAEFLSESEPKFEAVQRGFKDIVACLPPYEYLTPKMIDFGLFVNKLSNPSTEWRVVIVPREANEERGKSHLVLFTPACTPVGRKKKKREEEEQENENEGLIPNMQRLIQGCKMNWRSRSSRLFNYL